MWRAMIVVAVLACPGLARGQRSQGSFSAAELERMGSGRTAQPTSRPTPLAAATRPDSPETTAARELLANAEAACLAKLRQSEDYAKLKGDSQSAFADLQAAREGDDAQAKLSASAKYTRAASSVKAAEDHAIATDPDVKVARDKLNAARVSDVKAAQAAAEREANDPIRKAIREHYLIRGMTVDQAKQSLGLPSAVTDGGLVKSYVWTYNGEYWSAGFIEGTATTVSHSR